MADEATSIEQPGATPNRLSGLMTVVTLLCIALGCSLECIQTIHNPRPLRVVFATAYFFAAAFTGGYAVWRTFLNGKPPRRWKKGDPKLLCVRVIMISATLLMMGCVAGNLVPSAGSMWRTLADDAFPWLFVLNCQPDFFTERLPIPPPWPQTPLGNFWNRLRRAFSRRHAGAT